MIGRAKEKTDQEVGTSRGGNRGWKIRAVTRRGKCKVQRQSQMHYEHAERGSRGRSRGSRANPSVWVGAWLGTAWKGRTRGRTDS